MLRNCRRISPGLGGYHYTCSPPPSPSLIAPKGDALYTVGDWKTTSIGKDELVPALQERELPCGTRPREQAAKRRADALGTAQTGGKILYREIPEEENHR